MTDPHGIRDRSAETGGPGLQVDLSVVLPSGAAAVRSRALLGLLNTGRGVGDAHLREAEGRVEVCLHYDPEQVTVEQLSARVRAAGVEVEQRYCERTFTVRGMAAGQNGPVIEAAVGELPGVLSAKVGYASEQLVVEYDDHDFELSRVASALRGLGFSLEEPGSERPGAAHDHAHGGGLASALEVPLAITSGVLIAVGWLSSGLGWQASFPPTILYILAAVAGGLFTARDAVNAARRRRLDIEILMFLAAVGAAALGAWFEAALLLFLFALGHALEHRAMERARKAIEALGQLRPETARRAVAGGQWVEVAVAEIVIGERVLVRPGDRVPLDGTIREGTSSLDQAAITGESVPVARGPGDAVFAGTINTEGALEIEVTRLASQSALARIMELVAQAEAQKSPTQRFTERFERLFVPAVLAAAVILTVVLMARGKPLGGALLRAMALLVAASPCALAIATPSAVLAAVARAARSGVLVKGGAHLESLGRVEAIAFDKTGTLTRGTPNLMTAFTADGVSERELLETAAAVEALSAHPLAKAVLEGATARGFSAAPATEFQAIHGKGLRARIGSDTVTVGSLDLFPAVPPAIGAEVARLQEAGQTTMLVERAGRLLGVLGVADELRPEARAALARLAELGVSRTVMLSGDNARVAGAVGAQLGIREVRAPLMPADKVTALRELASHGGVAMVGDGVNDAPALAAASVGIAMGGAGSDVALETADIVLMSDDLGRLPFAVGLARAASRAIRQNLWASLGVSALLIVAAIVGWVRISHAVIIHEGSTLLVIGNALRLLAYREPQGISTPPSSG